LEDNSGLEVLRCPEEVLKILKWGYLISSWKPQVHLESDIFGSSEYHGSQWRQILGWFPNDSPRLSLLPVVFPRIFQVTFPKNPFTSPLYPHVELMFFPPRVISQPLWMDFFYTILDGWNMLKPYKSWDFSAIFSLSTGDNRISQPL
jgi:hypothetical protein